MRASPTSLGFVTPQIDPGTYSLALSADGVVYPAIAFTVGSALVVTDPVGTVQTQMQTALANINTLQAGATNDATYSAIYSAMAANLQNFQMQFAALSPDDQAKVAAFMAANQPATAMLGWGNWSVSVVTQWLVVGIEIGAFTAGFLTAQPWLMVAAGSMLMQDGSQLVNMYATGTQQVFEDAQSVGGDSSGGVGDVSPDALTVLMFSNGQAATVPFTAKMKNLSAGDLSSSVSSVQTSAASLEAFIQAWPTFDPGMNPSIPSPPDLSTIQEIVQDVLVDGSTISVSGVTSGVMLTADVPASMGAALTFTSAGCNNSTASIPFTFVATYSETDFPDQQSTINATLSCAPAFIDAGPVGG